MAIKQRLKTELTFSTMKRFLVLRESSTHSSVLVSPCPRYRVPELNVQNGVLKSLSFLFEYIGEMGKDYIYAVTPLLEDALMDRDLVHRQVSTPWHGTTQQSTIRDKRENESCLI